MLNRNSRTTTNTTTRTAATLAAGAVLATVTVAYPPQTVDAGGVWGGGSTRLHAATLTAAPGGGVLGVM